MSVIVARSSGHRLELGQTVRVLQGVGPPGTTTDTNGADVGVMYLDTTSDQLWVKTTNGAGTDKWTPTLGVQLYSERINTPITPPYAAAQNSVAIGQGAQTEASATGSLALGDQSFARHRGAQVFANGRFATTGDCQVGKYLLRTHTTTAAVTEVLLDGTSGSQRLTLPDDSTWTFTITVTGHRTDVGDGHAGYQFAGVIFRRNGAATTSFQGTPVKTVVAESDDAWDVTLVADSSTGSLSIRVKGQVGKTIRWAASVETVEVTN